jgi:transcriptional regulator with XRE-family HTH domain
MAKEKKITRLKIWLLENNINQKELADKTMLSTNTINRLVNSGQASNSVIKLISYELSMDIEQVKELLKFKEEDELSR